ncbi:sugar ABC transporter permease [Eubacteriales bacterium OttesenSCG-928-N13]|nr:sugar ABC transporter permease [Eubacteriales bacterium OttesenSCG-928-N13]
MLRWIDKRIQYFFAAPAILLTLVMIAYPLFYSVRMSFFDWNMSAKVPEVWVGISNYLGLFKDQMFLQAVGFTVLYCVVAVLFEALLGISLAIFASKLRRGGTLIKTSCVLPMVTTPIVVGMLWKMMMDPAIGVFNTILGAVGLPTSLWLTSTATVFPSLIMISVWMGTPMIMLIIMGGITSLSNECYEAAYVDGATEWQVVRKITLPLLRPTINVALILKMIDNLKTFDIIYSSTQGGPQNSTINLNYMIYKNLFEYFKVGKASAALVVFLALVFGLTLIMIALNKRSEVT